MKSKKTTLPDGTQNWRNSRGELHREDGPAVIEQDGTHIWYLNGKFQNASGPTIVWTNGIQFWYLNGKLYRTDGKRQNKLKTSEIKIKLSK